MNRTNTFHRFTAGLLCFIMVLTVTLSVMPLTAVAFESASVRIFGQDLNGEKLYYVNKQDGTQGETFLEEPAEWNAYFNIATNTLTLKNLFVDNSSALKDIGNTIASTAIDISGDVTIVLQGDNNVSCEEGAPNGYGIYVESGNLTITGSGTLTCKGASVRERSIGLYLKEGNLTILDCTVTSYGGIAAESYGVYVNGAITATGKNFAGYGDAAAKSYGVYSDSVTIPNGSKVNASGYTAALNAVDFSGYSNPLISVSEDRGDHRLCVMKRQSFQTISIFIFHPGLMILLSPAAITA